MSSRTALAAARRFLVSLPRASSSTSSRLASIPLAATQIPRRRTVHNTSRTLQPHPTAPASATATDAAPETVSSPAPPRWTPSSRRVGLIARKRGMISYFRADTGHRIPATVLQLEANQVSALIGFGAEDKYTAIQVAATDARAVTNQVKGHLRKAGINNGKKVIREFRVTKDAAVPLGTRLSALHFVPGQYVDARALTRGKGFQGAMKRHGFHGLRASHGVSISHRSHGSTGQHQDPGRVFPGKKMAGRMGGRYSTVDNLRVLRVDLQKDIIVVQGAVPGPEGGDVTLVDAKREVRWRAEFAARQGRLPDGSLATGSEPNAAYLPDGVDDLPFPAGTKSMTVGLPPVIEAAPLTLREDSK